MDTRSPIDKAAELEAAIRQMTLPINGQYPRPWMTNSTNPASSKVFTVGKNQRNGFLVEDVGPHEHYVNALFNRGPETCRELYTRITERDSPTRQNTDRLVQKLANVGVNNVLETNVICYSTPMSADLRLSAHAGGQERGEELFRTLLSIIKPTVLITHGSDTARKLSHVLSHPLPAPPEKPGEPVEVQLGNLVVFLIPSLAPPAYNKWASWAQDHLDLVCGRVAKHLS